MARVSTYLNFMGNTFEAFEYYRTVFGTDYSAPVLRMGDFPVPDGAPGSAPAERDLVMHIELPILAGHVLQGTDMLASMGHELRVGNNTTIVLEPDTRAETDRLYAGLSDGGSDVTGMTEQFWGYWGTCLDRFGIRWMFTCTEPAGSA
jgi:PhnB protein